MNLSTEQKLLFIEKIYYEIGYSCCQHLDNIIDNFKDDYVNYLTNFNDINIKIINIPSSICKICGCKYISALIYHAVKEVCFYIIENDISDEIDFMKFAKLNKWIFP